MSSIQKQDPRNLMPRLQDEINRLFGNAAQTEGSSSATAAWIPAVDVHEYGDRFELYVDLPGVDPTGVELTLEDGILTLSGERGLKVTKKGDSELQYQRVERSLGRFHRRFVLPDTVDSEKVNASGKDGVLTVKIPKQPKTLPRRIQIS